MLRIIFVVRRVNERSTTMFKTSKVTQKTEYTVNKLSLHIDNLP